MADKSMRDAYHRRVTNNVMLGIRPRSTGDLELHHVDLHSLDRLLLDKKFANGSVDPVFEIVAEDREQMTIFADLIDAPRNVPVNQGYVLVDELSHTIYGISLLHPFATVRAWTVFTENAYDGLIPSMTGAMEIGKTATALPFEPAKTFDELYARWKNMRDVRFKVDIPGWHIISFDPVVAGFEMMKKVARNAGPMLPEDSLEWDEWIGRAREHPGYNSSGR